MSWRSCNLIFNAVQMELAMAEIRLSAKAIVIREERLLVIRNRDAVGDWYVLPGGGQHAGETIAAAVRRECVEEIAADVTVGRLRFVREYIGQNHEFAETDANVHQVELMFECLLKSEPRHGDAPDSLQTGIEWLRLRDLINYRLYPRALIPLLVAGRSSEEPVYLGDAN